MFWIYSTDMEIRFFLCLALYNWFFQFFFTVFLLLLLFCFLFSFLDKSMLISIRKSDQAWYSVPSSAKSFLDASGNKSSQREREREREREKGREGEGERGRRRTFLGQFGVWLSHAGTFFLLFPLLYQMFSLDYTDTHTHTHTHRLTPTLLSMLWE